MNVGVDVPKPLPVPKGKVEMKETQRIQAGTVFKDSRGIEYLRRHDGSIRRLTPKK